eukprot:TRINITY_DN11393_c0_g4_i2.p1 TRINITY_DN11393_c0_g4~~TRINITY_DN11393_c0_g4_i2.p1  ORF type:complete len:335 (+),score=34.04 TRINITY_DN11393_c0_g4_i2:395-1399(+)
MAAFPVALETGLPSVSVHPQFDCQSDWLCNLDCNFPASFDSVYSSETSSVTDGELPTEPSSPGDLAIDPTLTDAMSMTINEPWHFNRQQPNFELLGSSFTDDVDLFSLDSSSAPPTSALTSPTARLLAHATPQAHCSPSSPPSCNDGACCSSAPSLTYSTAKAFRPKRAASSDTSQLVARIFKREAVDDDGAPVAPSASSQLDDKLDLDFQPTKRVKTIATCGPTRRRASQNRKKGSTKPRTPRLQSKEGARQRLKALCKLYLTHKSQHPSLDPNDFIIWVRETRFRKADTRCTCEGGPSHTCACTTCAHCRFEKNVQLCIKGEINWPYKPSKR